MIYIALLVVVVVVSSNIFSRLRRIEENLGINKSESESAQSSNEVDSSDQMTETVPKPLGPSHDTEAQTEGSDIIAWIREDWLMKVGALLILIAFGWFVSYAFAQGWIGPVGRISLGLTVGAGVMAFGMYYSSKSKNKGVVTKVLGSTIILATLMAGQHIYNFFEPFTTLIVMLVVSMIVAVFSVIEKTKALAFSSLILGLLTPVLVSADLAAVAVLSYIAAVVAGTLWIVILTKWRNLTIVALLGTFLYSLEYILPWSSEEQVVFYFAIGFAVVFFGINIYTYLRDSIKSHASDIVVTLGTGFFLLVWILKSLESSMQSIVLLASAVVFGAVAYVLYRSTDSLAAFSGYLAVAITFLATATWFEFSGAVLTIVYSLEIFTLITLFSTFVMEKKETSRLLSLLYTVPVSLSFTQIFSPSWDTGILHVDAVALLILTAIFLLSAMHFYEHVESGDDSEDDQYVFTKMYAIAAAVYASVLLWLSLHAVNSLSLDMATAIALLVFTVVGLYLYFRGKRDDHQFILYLGLIYVWGVIARLMFVEFWLMDTTGKIVTFLIIGGLLFATAFLEPEDVIDEK
jgi:uncharacterized membrane protein